MPSKIQVDQIAGATGSTVTLPSGQTLDLSSGTVNLPSASLSALNASNLTSGTVPSARLSLTSSDLPTVPTTKGGTGLTTIGTANQVLRVNSGATALEFGTAPSGKVLQVIEASDGTARTTTSTSYVTSSNTLSVTITPSSASNKVLIFANITYSYNGTGRVDYTVFRGATNLAPVNSFTANHSGGIEMPVSFMYLDSPSSTSALTYQVYFKVSSATGYMNATNNLSTIHCLEIAG